MVYYVSFRHRRPLEAVERDLLLATVTRVDGRKWELLIACVLPEKTDLMLTVMTDASGQPYELSDVLEGIKRRVGKKLIGKSGERFPPFTGESYDRIIRDDAELEEKWQAIFEAPIELELASEDDEYPHLWVSSMPQTA